MSANNQIDIKPQVAAPPQKHFSVVVIGGGQAGLSASYLLKERGIDHIVFEKNRLAESWRSKRWETFCLVTPNWQCQLPGHPYSGPDPHGFMVKDEIVAYIESYARSFQPPIYEGVTVSRLRREDTGAFEVTTDIGIFNADQVIVATGGYQDATIPRMAERVSPDVHQIHSSDYKNAESLPPGEVLVVGSGQSGCQIAEDLHLAGRRVHLCVGGAPRTARRYRGKDVVDWLNDMGYYDKPIHEHPQKERVRSKSNHYVTGRDGGRDIDLRKFAQEGMRLYGRLKEVRGSMLRFAADLKQNLDQADAVAESIKNTIDKHIEPGHKGFYVSWQSASQQVAVMVASLLGVGLELVLAPATIDLWGWRIPFLVGCLIIPLLFLLRRSLTETEAFEARKHHPTISQIIRTVAANWTIVLLGMMLVAMTTVSFYLITAYTPTFGQSELHLQSVGVLIVTLCVGLSNFFWLPVMGSASDRVGRKPLLIIFTVLALLTVYPAMLWLTAEPSFVRLLLVELWLSFIYASYNGAMVVTLTEIMPVEVRTSGFSLAYSLATAVLGGFTPAICTYLIHITGNHAAPGLWMSFAALLGLVAAFIIPRPESDLAEVGLTHQKA